MTLLPPGVKVHLAYGYTDNRAAAVPLETRTDGDGENRDDLPGRDDYGYVKRGKNDAADWPIAEHAADFAYRAALKANLPIKISRPWTVDGLGSQRGRHHETMHQ